MCPQAMFFLLFTLSTVPVLAEPNDSAPMTCAQVVAWTAGGMPTQRLDRLTHQRGLAFPLDAATSNSLSAAGMDPALLQSLRAIAPKSENRADCPGPLVRASALVRQKKYPQAQSILQKLIAADPSNPALHFAMGYVHQQQDDWDEASDSYEAARALMPGLSDIHSRLAYLLYRSDDGDDAIAEARTALSIDPGNGEAYRFLGLGLYASGRYPAAVHAFSSRWRASPTTLTFTMIWVLRSAIKATWMPPHPPTVKPLP